MLVFKCKSVLLFYFSKIFYTDTREIQWDKYTENYCLGCKIFLVKEDLKNVPKAKTHLKRYVVGSPTFQNIVILKTVNKDTHGCSQLYNKNISFNMTIKCDHFKS